MLSFFLTLLAGLLLGLGFLALLIYRQLHIPHPSFPSPPAPLFTSSSDRSVRHGLSHAFSPSAPSAYDVIIIGSGLSGLTCAVLLSIQGYRVLVLEAHDVAGGCTHTWKASGVGFATGVHYVGGDVGRSTSAFRRMMDIVTGGRVQWRNTWEEACDDPDMAGVYDIVHLGQRRLVVKAGTRRWTASAIAQFPDEESAIRRYVALTLRINREAQLHFLLHNVGPRWLYRLLAPVLLRTFTRYAGVSTQAVLESLTSSVALRSFLSYTHFDYGSVPSQSSFVAHAVAQAYFYRGTAYPIGGPGQIAKAAVAEIESRGGRVVVRSEVDSVVIEAGRAVGVRLRGGRVIPALVGVVSSVGVRRTYQRLIGDEDRALVAAQLKALEDDGGVEGKGLGQAAAHFSLFFAFEGDMDALGIPVHNTFVLPDDDVHQSAERWAGPSAHTPLAAPLAAAFITFASRKDPSCAARLPSIISGQVLAEGRYEWMANRGADYDAFKAAMEARLLACLFQHFPALEGLPRVHVELGTPLSSERWLGAEKGSSYGMAHSVERVKAEWMRCSVQGVEGLWLAGTDVVMAGLEGAVMSGALCAAAVDKGSLWRNLNAIVGARVIRSAPEQGIASRKKAK